MAAPTHNSSRREVLGAAVALPLLPLDGGWGPGSSPGRALAGRMVGVEDGLGADSSAHHSTSEATPPLTPPHQGEGDWRRALAAYRSAEVAVEEAGRRCASCSRAEIHSAEDEYGDRLEALYERLRGLLTVRAPDLNAFCTKVELMIEHELATLSGSAASLAAIRDDARRLPSREA